MLNTKSSMMKDRNRNTTFTNIPILRKKWGIFSKNEAGTYNFSIHICLCDEVILGLYHKFWGFNHGMKGWNYLCCYIDMPFLLLTFDHELHMSSLTFVINMVHFKQTNWHVQSLAYMYTCLAKNNRPFTMVTSPSEGEIYQKRQPTTVTCNQPHRKDLWLVF